MPAAKLPTSAKHSPTMTRSVEEPIVLTTVSAISPAVGLPSRVDLSNSRPTAKKSCKKMCGGGISIGLAQFTYQSNSQMPANSATDTTHQEAEARSTAKRRRGPFAAALHRVAAAP